MEEATLLMKINKNKNTAKAIAREKMIDEFLTKVTPKESVEHRVDRVLSFISSRWNWDSPSHAGERVPPPPRGSGGGGILACGRGGGESQFRRGVRHCGTLGIYVFCGAEQQRDVTGRGGGGEAAMAGRPGCTLYCLGWDGDSRHCLHAGLDHESYWSVLDKLLLLFYTISSHSVGLWMRPSPCSPSN